MNKDISFIDFTNMSDEEKYKLLNSKDYKIERLNNIINEFERLLQQDLENEKDTYWTNIKKEDYIQFMLNKLQELKGSNEPSFEEMVGFVENVYKDIKSQSTLHEELEEERKTIAKIVGDFKEVKKNEF